MQHRTMTLITLLFAILPLTGCATIMKGPEQNIFSQSDPTAATLSVFDSNGMMVAEGKTPVTLPLKKGDGFFQAAKYRIVFEAPG